MFDGMMDPELMRMAQEQLSRIPPQELAKIQQQMMSNPELVKLATESMKGLKPEDMRSAAEQLKNTRVEDMVHIGEKMAKATPEEIAAMHANADAQISYYLNAAEVLKKQGNDFHSRGRFNEAAQKYTLAKSNLKDLPAFKCRTLQVQCSLNLMSCYLKMGKFEECVKEGSDVLLYDTRNVKALYRRGQAYKELGRFKAAISDLSIAHDVSPEDETILETLRDANEKLSRIGDRTVSGNVIIEELVEEDNQPLTSEDCRGSAEYSVSPPSDINEGSHSEDISDGGTSMANADHLQGLNDNPEAFRLFQNYVSSADPASLASLSCGQMSPEMVKTASEMIREMKPEELQKMLKVATSLNHNGPKFGSHLPNMTPEMVQMASDRIGKMSPEEIQKMIDASSSLNPGFSRSPLVDSARKTQQSEINSPSSDAPTNIATENDSIEESSSRGVFESSSIPSSSFSNSTSDLQDNMRNAMKDPAMRQMFSSMMKNMSPEMMANMSEQFGMKLSKEEAAKAQQAMSSLSMDDLDRMMRWAERAQRGVDAIKKTKSWLLGTPGLILAIGMLILAFVFHQLGLIGG